MSEEKARDPPPEGAPSRLTRHALWELRLEEMRQCGEPTEGMSRYAPTATYTTENSDERAARVFALIQAHGITSLSPSMAAERELDAQKWIRIGEESKRRRRDELSRSMSHYRAGSWRTGPRIARSEGLPSRGSMWSKDPFRPRVQSEPPFRGRAETGSDRGPPHTGSLPSGRVNSSWFYRRTYMDGYIRSYGDGADPRTSGDACNGSNWSHSAELRLLQDDMLEAAKFRPETRSLFHTFDMNAFSGEPNKDDDNDAPRPGEAASTSAVPADFPPHRAVDGMIELGTYLASSSYIVSLGGPPLADLKYGIIVVPVGEEPLLFTGYGDHAGMSAGFKAEVYAKSKAAQKEQVKEWRQMAADELANGLESEPEPLDDDEREFYRKRWLARKGSMLGRRGGLFGLDDDECALPTATTKTPGPEASGDDDEAQPMEGDTPGGDGTQPMQETTPTDDDGTRLMQEDTSGDGGTQSMHENAQGDGKMQQMQGDAPRDDGTQFSMQDDTPADDDKTQPMQEDAPEPVHEQQGPDTSADGQSPPAPSIGGAVAVRPVSHAEGDVFERERASVPEEASTRSRGSQTSGQGADNHIHAEMDAHTEQDQARNCNGHDRISNEQGQPATSTPSTLRNAVREESMSPEACRAFELLLRGERKRKGTRRVLSSLLSGTKLRRSPSPTVSRRVVLLEVAKAMTRLANGELCENPGIDQRVWEAALKNLG